MLSKGLLVLSVAALTCFPARASGPPRLHVVMVSDSRGNCVFGGEMNRLLRTLDRAYVHSMAVGGSSPRTWLDPQIRIRSPLGIEDRGQSGEPLPKKRPLKPTLTPHFPTFLEASFKSHPSARRLVIINQGTNALTPKQLEVETEAMIRAVFSRGSDCAWISPPHNRTWSDSRTYSIAAAIRRGAESAGTGGPSGKKCFIVESVNLTFFPEKLPPGPKVDGVHYCWHPELISRGKRWAQGAFEEIREQFPHL